MVNITLKMSHTRERKRTYENQRLAADPYHIPELYNRIDSRRETRELEMKLDNVTGLDEGELEKLINKCRWKMFEMLHPKPELETIPVQAKVISDTPLLLERYTGPKY